MKRALLAALVTTLLLAGPASAHVTVMPAFIATYDTQTFVFASPNERQAPMTGFSLTVPAGFEILNPGHEPPWHPVVLGSKVTWSGGSLPAAQNTSFVVALKGPTKPGAVTLDAEQLYPSGAVVRWPVAFMVVPGTQPSQHLGVAAIVAVAGLVVTVLFVVVAWRRRLRPAKSG